MNEEKYLRAKQIAKTYNIGLSTVWLYAKQGKITPLKLSQGVTVFELQEVNNLLHHYRI